MPAKVAKRTSRTTTKSKTTSRAKSTAKKSASARKSSTATSARRSSASKATGRATTRATAKRSAAGRSTSSAAASRSSTARPKKRAPNAAFMAPVQPDEILSAVVGSKPIPRTQVTKKLWAYIKKNDLQDADKRTMINADAKLKAVFGGKGKIDMFQMTKLVSKRLSRID